MTLLLAPVVSSNASNIFTLRKNNRCRGACHQRTHPLYQSDISSILERCADSITVVRDQGKINVPVAERTSVLLSSSHLFRYFLSSGNFIRQHFSIQNIRQCWRYGIQWWR